MRDATKNLKLVGHGGIRAAASQGRNVLNVIIIAAAVLIIILVSFYLVRAGRRYFEVKKRFEMDRKPVILMLHKEGMDIKEIAKKLKIGKAEVERCVAREILGGGM